MVSAPRTSPSLRQALREGRRLTASFVIIPRVEVVEALAYSGFDAVILDREHGSIGVGDLPALVAAGQSRGLFVMVRVRENTASEIGMVLDAGVDGLLVPHVQTVEDAATVVEASRFPPVGQRSLNPYVRAAHYSADRDYLARAEAAVAVFGMIEGSDGVANCEEILVVPGLDGVFVGPVDLSAALGHPGEPEHPAVVQQVRTVVDRAQSENKATGVFAGSAQAARPWAVIGVQLLVVGVDSGFLLDGARRVRERLEQGDAETSTGEERRPVAAANPDHQPRSER